MIVSTRLSLSLSLSFFPSLRLVHLFYSYMRWLGWKRPGASVALFDVSMDGFSSTISKGCTSYDKSKSNKYRAKPQARQNQPEHGGIHAAGISSTELWYYETPEKDQPHCSPPPETGSSATFWKTNLCPFPIRFESKNASSSSAKGSPAALPSGL